MAPASESTEYGGPAGTLRKVFEEVSALPRRQQDKVVEFVAAFVCRHAGPKEVGNPRD